MDGLTLNLMELMGKRREIEVSTACPWCNEKNVSLHDDEDMFWCHCDSCGADGPPKLTAEDAVEAWENNG